MKQRIILLAFAVTLVLTPAGGRLHAQQCATPGPQAANDELAFPKQTKSLAVLTNDAGGDLLLMAPAQQASANGTLALSDDAKEIVFTPAAGATAGSFAYEAFEATNTSLRTTAVVTLLPNGSVTSGGFTYSCDGRTCSFDPTVDPNGVRNYRWEWGHAAPNNVLDPWTGSTAVHTFPAYGTFSVTLRVDYYDGRHIDVLNVPVTVTQSTPKVVWSIREDSQATKTWGERVTIKVDSVTDPTITFDNCYDWEFLIQWGDGTSQPLTRTYCFINTDVEYSHWYDRDDSYQIKIQVIAKPSNVVYAEYPKWHWAANKAPIPHLEITPVGDAATTKTFKLNPYIVVDEYDVDSYVRRPGPYEYDFDDGNFAIGEFYPDNDPQNARKPKPVTYTFGAPGTRYVKVRVADWRGAVGMGFQPLVIPDGQPAAKFSYTCTGRTCSFDGSESVDDLRIVSYNWNFGGTPQSFGEPATSFTFPAAGTYTVTLSVSAATLDPTYNQQSAQFSRVITVTDGAPIAGMRYFSLTPCRLFDSREAGGLPLQSGVLTEVAIAGKCGVPSNAAKKAVAINVTVVSPTAVGHLLVHDQNANLPIASTLNFHPSRAPRANSTVALLSDRGTVYVRPTVFAAAGSPATTHVLIDVTGYYSTDLIYVAPPGGGSGKGPYALSTMDPCRAYDSRQFTALASGGTAYVKVRGKCGVPDPLPATGGAISYNLAVVGATQDGHIVAAPSDATWDLIGKTSAVNFQAAAMNISGSGIVGLGNRAADDVSFTYAAVAPGSTHYVLDVSGWFSQFGGNLYHPIRPCRAVDTRMTERGDPKMKTGVEARYQIKGNCGVPANAVAAIVTTTAVAPDTFGHLTLYASGTPLPVASALNIPTGETTIANTALVRLSPDNLDLTARFHLYGVPEATTHFVVDVIGYFAPVAAGAAAEPAEAASKPAEAALMEVQQ